MSTFKITAYKGGNKVTFITINDPKEIETTNTLMAMVEATKTFNDSGVDYDELVITFLRLSVDLGKLNELFLAPDDLSLGLMERQFEITAATQTEA